MPLDLTFGDDGMAEGLTPWHREGHILTATNDFDQALRLGGLDYHVEKVPAWIEIRPDDFAPSQKVFIIRRVDTKQELGGVGTSYTPIQNWEAFQVLRPLVDAGILILETCGVLRGGADAWLMGRWNVEQFGPVVREVFTDQIVPYSVVVVNHSGRASARIGNTPIRIVCGNTLAMAVRHGLSRWMAIRHTSLAGQKLQDAAQVMFGAIVERYEIIASQYQDLRNTQLSTRQFSDEVLDTVAPWPPIDAAPKRVDRVQARRERITELWSSGLGHLGDHSAWEAYNAVVQSIDHDTVLWPARSRTGALLDGVLAQKKNAVLDRLTQYVRVV